VERQGPTPRSGEHRGVREDLPNWLHWGILVLNSAVVLCLLALVAWFAIMANAHSSDGFGG
jgi:hypothetical protein